MNYRQWKKNYKKKHGENPPVSVDKRKQQKLAKRALKAIIKIDFEETVKQISKTIADAFSLIYKSLGNAFEGAAMVCKDCAEILRDKK